MIDSSEKAYEAVPKILAANVDVLFCNMVKYATSSAFAPIVKEVNKLVEARGEGCYATYLLDERKLCLQYPSRTNIAKNDYQSFF